MGSLMKVLEEGDFDRARREFGVDDRGVFEWYRERLEEGDLGAPLGLLVLAGVEEIDIEEVYGEGLRDLKGKAREVGLDLRG